MSSYNYFVKLRKEDNVVTTTKKIPAQTVVIVDSVSIDVLQDIPLGHKIAIETIEKGEAIVKYGVKIGVANAKIMKGEHVHIHNVDDVSLEIRDEAKRRSLGGL
jgi:altronate dehydratase